MLSPLYLKSHVKQATIRVPINPKNFALSSVPNRIPYDMEFHGIPYYVDGMSWDRC